MTMRDYGTAAYWDGAFAAYILVCFPFRPHIYRAGTVLASHSCNSHLRRATTTTATNQLTSPTPRRDPRHIAYATSTH